MSRYLDWLDEIRADEGQFTAFNRSGHCVVIAGPGTGKTRVLVMKASKLLYDEVFPPRGIACVTYAHAMAEELRRHISELGILSESYNVFIGTLHSYCFSNILKPFGYLYGLPLPKPIIMASEKQQVQTYVSVWEKLPELQRYGDLFAPSRDKNGDLTPYLPVAFQKYRGTHLNENDKAGKDPIIDNAVTEYENLLLASRVIDFEMSTKWSVGLVEQQEFVRKALEAKFPWLLVDEYQDLGLALHRIVKTLTKQTGIKLFAIGDPNQCIYDFSGASPDYFQELEKDIERYGEPIRLEINYRSCPEIIEAVNNVPPRRITQIPNRKHEKGVYRVINCTDQMETLVTLIKKLQDLGFEPDEVMILCRYTKDCIEIVNELKQRYPELPVSKSAGQVYNSRVPLLEWIEYLIIYSVSQDGSMKVRFNDLCQFWATLLDASGISSSETLSFENRYRLFIALSTAKQFASSANNWLIHFCELLNIDDLLEKYQEQRPEDIDEYNKLKSAIGADGIWENLSLTEMADLILQKNRLTVGTLHSSKGQEKRAIILAKVQALNSRKPDVQVSNRRLFYVGMTRAMDILLLLHDGSSFLINYVIK